MGPRVSKAIGMHEYGSICVQMLVCLHVELFYGKTFPCCLGLVCAGAILSCSQDCNEQLAAHQALSLGPGFPGRLLGPVYVCGGCSLVLGDARAGLCVCEHSRSQHGALC